ncbi:hypothetical protein VSU19_02935 [Verrucomicrobiales bacterium BCK34]|nr:hypothetical protein [Verrucomicrobiales bacterium BCK34]
MRFLILTVAVLVVFASPLTGMADSAESVEGQTGLAALDQFVSVAKLAPDEEVLGVAGFYGESQPGKWLILSADPATPGILRESVFVDGAVLAERTFRRLPDQSVPEIRLDREGILIDSDKAFEVVAMVARSEQRTFQYAHFQLRMREEGNEPIWMVSLLNKAQVPLGTLYVSAKTGEIVRRAWIKPASPRKVEVDDSISLR